MIPRLSPLTTALFNLAQGDLNVVDDRLVIVGERDIEDSDSDEDDEQDPDFEPEGDGAAALAYQQELDARERNRFIMREDRARKAHLRRLLSQIQALMTEKRGELVRLIRNTLEGYQTYTIPLPNGAFRRPLTSDLTPKSTDLSPSYEVPWL